MGAWYRIILGLARGIFALLGGLRALHRERVPAKGAAILASTHFSHLDPPAVACGCDRQLAFFAKAELFKVPILAPLIRSLGAFPARRGEGDMEAFRKSLALLEEGRAVLIFPEGTRGDGVTLGELNRGATLLAKKSGATVIPVAISGSHLALPKGAKGPKRHRIIVAYGEPLSYAEIATGDDKADRERFAKALESRLLALSEEAGLPLKTERCIEPRS